MVKKILIIEDEKVLNDMYALKFKKEWFDVESAYSGLEWLTKIANSGPDVILLDIMMPSMNGFETLEVIKSQSSSHCKIVMFTNIVDKEKLEQAIQMWADDYLVKSDTTPSDAVDKVNTLLGRKKVGDSKHVVYVEPWLNHFKIKNPAWWEDISVDINIHI